jgi:hypothetical protein
MSSFRRFHSIAALCGDGLRPELQALFERLAVDPHTELFARDDGMVQSGPDPVAGVGGALLALGPRGSNHLPDGASRIHQVDQWNSQRADRRRSQYPA